MGVESAYTYRDEFAADILTKLMKDYPFDERIFHVAPLLVDEQIQFDRCAWFFNRDFTYSL